MHNKNADWWQIRPLGDKSIKLDGGRWDWSIVLVLNQNVTSETTKVSSGEEVSERQGSKQQPYFIWMSEKHFYALIYVWLYLNKKRLQPSPNRLQHNTIITFHNNWEGGGGGEGSNPDLFKEFSLKYFSLLGTDWKKHTILQPHIYRGLWLDFMMLFDTTRNTFRNLGGKTLWKASAVTFFPLQSCLMEDL